MSIYYLRILDEQRNDAGSKARDDIGFFLSHSNNIKILTIYKKKRLIEKIVFTKRIIRNNIKNLDSNDTIIISYPIFFNNYFSRYFLKLVYNKKIKIIFLIHDVITLRKKLNKEQVGKEIGILNKSKAVISHNKMMSSWLCNNGLKKIPVELHLFDYHNPIPISMNVNHNRVIFAGNLIKAKFLDKLGDINTDFLLYGPNPSNCYPKCMKYQGVYSPDELPKYINGGYGLVWDGDSVDNCTGEFGEYMKYNNPHKVSLYLSCGLPVIVWRDAAIASLIKRYNLGFCVKSLNEIDEQIKTISEEDYLDMRRCVQKLSLKIRSGYFISNALRNAGIKL